MDRRLVEKINNLLSKEKGTVFKDPGGKINICLIYPNIYRVGMSNLGFQGIYGIFNRRRDVVCERAFLPDEKEIEIYRKTGTPVFSFESKRQLNRFDIVAFSISFENDYPNVLKILDIANIPFHSSERDKYQPLLIAGGVCTFFNPEPIAPIFDIVFVGEAEESLSEFIDIYKKTKDKIEVKNAAVDINGIYVPELYQVTYNDDGTIHKRTSLAGAPEKIKRQYLNDLSSCSITTSIITPKSEFSNMYLIEAMRGCPWSCRFCLVGHIYNPPRKKELIAIKAEIDMATNLIRWKYRDTESRGDGEGRVKIGLTGPSLTDYPHIKDVLCIDGVDFSITSLRACIKSAEIVELMKGHKSISIAPEAGTERMRRVINKKITEKDILITSEIILNAGIENLRLYFMIGLPTETGDDISGIVELAKKIRRISNKGNIILSISTFVPKPFTPFQWHSMDSLNSAKGKLKFIKKSLRGLYGIKVLHDVPRHAHMQGLFSMGDRRVFHVLELMVKENDYKKACLEAGVDADFYIFRNRSFNETLPWDFIDMGTTKQRLWNEYNFLWHPNSSEDC